MKVYDKRRDYYDSCVAFGGIDPSLHYVRDSRITNVPHVGAWNAPQEFGKLPSWSDYLTDFRSYLIGFCGKLYPVLHVSHAKDVTSAKTVTCFYTADDYEAWMNELKTELGKPYLVRRYRSSSRDRDIEEFFAQDRDVTDWHVKLDAPVFLVRNLRQGDREYLNIPEGHYNGVILETNPILKDFEFFKVKDVATAYQDIAMFLGNQLVKEREVEPIADKYRITQHGFDKFSFKHPVRLRDLKGE